MTLWNEGYNSDLRYTQGFYEETNPTSFRKTLLLKGIATKPIKRALDLGAGMFTTSIINSVINDIEWWAVDFMPSHVSHGRRIAAATGAELNIIEKSFEELANDRNLPTFDYIYLHGIWSWVSESNRNHILEIIKRCLSTDGIVFASYNVFPGWGPFYAIRNLMYGHYLRSTIPSEGTSDRIKKSIEFAISTLESAGPTGPVAKANLEKLKTIKSLDVAYLAHEYFNKDWHPTTILDVGAQFSIAKLSFAQTSNLNEMIGGVCFKKEVLDSLAGFKDPILAEFVKDVSVNIQFRKDYWSKTLTRINPAKILRELSGTEFVATPIADDSLYKIKGYLGEGDLHRDYYEPIFDKVYELHQGNVGQLIETILKKGADITKTIEVLATLIEKQMVHFCVDEQENRAIDKKAAKFNNYVIANWHDISAPNYVISPRTGKAIGASFIDKYCLNSLKDKKGKLDGIADKVSQDVAKELITVQINGKPIGEDRESLMEKIGAFKKRLPDFEIHGILAK